jgi:DNA-binding winged helix-turn-helix (wHTH) protein/tetratricopeptide (TPR) repeat protein
MSVRFYSFGPYQIDAEEQLLLREGRPLPLTPKLFELLIVLVANSGHILSKDELMKKVWADSFVEEGNLAVVVHELRKTLGGDSNGQSYIETIPRRGYRFADCVTEITDEHAISYIEDPAKAQALAASSGSLRTKSGTIAVLPFKSIGASTDEYLGLGMTDALITRLSNLRKVTVRPTTSVRRYDGTHDPVVAGKELGVEWVLDGSIRKSGKRMRLTVQLVHVGDAVVRWAEKFDEKFTNIFAVEDSISEQVAKALEPRLTGEDRRLLTKRYTESFHAFEAYLRGRYFLEKRSAEDCKRAIEYFELATKIDPGYALAYTELAACYIVMASTSVLSTADSYLKAEHAILIALDIDEELAEAHASMGQLKTRKWEWQAAEKELKRALELNPNYAMGHTWYALYLSVMDRFEEAFREIREAKSLDPLSTIIKSTEGSIFYLSRRYDEAIEQFRKTLEVDKGFAPAQSVLGVTYEAKGEYKEALKQYQQSLNVQGELPELVAFIARLDALDGRPAAALKAIERLKTWPQDRMVHPYSIALIYAALGDTEQTFRWLEKAIETRDEDLIILKVDARFDGIRGDPRFSRLLRQVGFST